MEGSQTNIEDAARMGGEIKPDGQIVPGQVTSTTNIVWLWDTRSYEKVPVLDYMLTNKLRQRRPDGSYQFTASDPGKLPVKGQVKCMLHPDNERRQYFDGLGFRVCLKANIKNKHELTMHMKRRHSQEWEALEQERKDKERAEDRSLQQLLLTSQMQKADVPKVEEEDEVGKFKCKKCGKEISYKKTYKRHVKECMGG